ncbi:MAG TPA: PDZ domain-containing protein [Candidatus Krumholzibacteria bacterium]|nr:PDZ domain-containing protein [Candidatus Krumholzibacteria bacterium]
MNAQTGNGKHATLVVWTAVAVIAIAGASGVAVAKEKKLTSRSKSETPGGETGNGYIGVYLQELTSQVKKGLDLKVENGVLVSGVEEDSPADNAGIEDGDVIVRFNGKSVTSADELLSAVRATSPGKTAKVDVVHDGDSKTLTLTVSERPEHEAMRWESHGDGDTPMVFARDMGMFGGPRLGIQAKELDDEGLASYFGAKKGDGLLVLSVDDESVAGKAGVKAGDIISKVGDDKIEDTSDVRHALKDFDKGDKFDITVIRHGKPQSLKATMDEDHEFAFDAVAPEAFHWRGMMPPRAPHAPMAPRVYVSPGNRDELRRELDDLKQQIQELKEQLEDKNDG